MEQQRIYGIVILTEDGRMEVVTDFTLSKEEEKTIKDILSNHETDGSSIIGTKEEIIEEYSAKKPAGNLISIEGDLLTAGDLQELLSRADKTAPISVAVGYNMFAVSGGFIRGGTPYLESEDLLDYMGNYSME